MEAPVLAPAEEMLRTPPMDVSTVESSSWVSDAIHFAWDEVPFYRTLWEGAGWSSPPRLSDCPTWSVEDLKADQGRHPPYGTLYADFGIADVRWLVTSSGTTGVPRITAQCASDLPLLRQTYKRFFEFAGLRSDDVVANTFTYGPLAGAWSSTRACEEIGATLLPASNGRTTPPERLVTLIERIGLTTIIGMPSYLTHIAKIAEGMGVALQESSVRLLIIAGEGATSAARRELSERWGAETRNFYASSDVDWVAIECEASAATGGELGSHIFQDQCHVEILDSTGRSLPAGESGEVVITSWTRQSSPRIRYRTGDRSRIDDAPCECGRLSPRVMPIAGRTDQAVRFHGVTVRPEEVEKVLSGRFGRDVQFRLRHQGAMERADAKEALVIEVECTADELTAWSGERIAEHLQKSLGIKPMVALLETGALISAEDALQGKKTQQVVIG